MATDLHTALRSEVIDSVRGAKGLELKLVRLQHGKNLFTFSLHAFPKSFSSAGLQVTDFLAYIGFHRGPCVFDASECYAIAVSEEFSLAEFSVKFEEFSNLIWRAERQFDQCDLYLSQPEGWTYYAGGGRMSPRATPLARGNGHHSPKQELMKESEDASFQYKLTWIEGGADRGWVTHYRAKDKISAKQLAILPGIFQGFQRFAECPEFEFESCYWRFVPYISRDEGARSYSRVNHAHSSFDAHAKNFAPAILALFEADAVISAQGFVYLPHAESRALAPTLGAQKSQQAGRLNKGLSQRSAFICHAGEDKEKIIRPLVATLAEGGVSVWFDEAEVRWGDSLTKKVNEGLKISQFVVVVLSSAFVGRHWPERELNAALNIESSTGQVKVLPLLIGSDVEIKQILSEYPLLNDKKYIVWDGEGHAVLNALRQRLT